MMEHESDEAITMKPVSDKTFAIVGMTMLVALAISPFVLYGGPYLYDFFFYQPPQFGDTESELRARLGTPIYDSWRLDAKPSAAELDDLKKPRRLVFASGDGRRFILTLDAAGVVIDIQRDSR
jgi:hypothetical protein